jgi:hypothetical protein
MDDFKKPDWWDNIDVLKELKYDDTDYYEEAMKMWEEEQEKQENGRIS